MPLFWPKPRRMTKGFVKKSPERAQRPICCWASRITQNHGFYAAFEAEARERGGEGGTSGRLTTDLDFPRNAGNGGHTRHEAADLPIRRGNLRFEGFLLVRRFGCGEVIGDAYFFLARLLFAAARMSSSEV
jgi:hypothetical protein